MKTKLVYEQQPRTFAVIFEKGEEVAAGLLEFAKQHDVTAASLTAIGALSDVTLGYFDRERKDYRKIPLTEQVEVLALIGNIALSEGQPKVHAHLVVGKADGTAHGGHLLEAHVWPTLEVIVTEVPRHLQRQFDAETRLALIQV